MKKNKQTYFIIDFDSTFITSEGLDELAKVSLHDHPEKDTRVEEIIALTNQGMEGKLPFDQSLRKRVELLETNKKVIEKAGKLLAQKVSASILRNKAFFRKHKDHIYIVSGGFKELINPVVKPYGIKEDHIFANTFVYSDDGKVIGIDIDNFMSQQNGKAKVVQSLNLKGDIIVIGDGYTDYELKQVKNVKKFIAFTENIEREIVTKKADHIAPNFDEFLYINNLPRSLSYPKNRLTFLALTAIDESDKKSLKKEGYTIIENDTVSDEELSAVINTVSILYIHDDSQLPQFLFEDANRLLAIGIKEQNKQGKLVSHVAQKGIAVFSHDRVIKRIIDFINTGDSYKSTTLPNINLPKHQNTHRLLHIHHNVPGILAHLNSVMAKHNMNISSQYLQTTEDIGYVITDVDKEYNKKVLEILKKIPHTIRFRVLY